VLARRTSSLSRPACYLAALVTFLFSWVLRYNNPEGSFAGLTDDHFWYVVSGWQMLFGDLPDRDYVDAGAPLTHAASAVMQLVLGRSVWSESVLCVTALALGAAITCVLSARATGSVVAGFMAGLFQIALLPRLYNYPKIVVYAVAIATIWAWASSPGARRTWLVAGVTAVAFLARHDHGVYVAVAFGALLLGIGELTWRQRMRHGAAYGLATLLLLAPYLVYLQVNGGIDRHFLTAYAWSAREYQRTPLRLPTLSWQPLFEEEPTEAPASEWWNHAPFQALTNYSTWWLFWFIVLLPAVVLLLLVVHPSTGPPRWPRERAKVLAVAVLLTVLNLRFLHGNLAARFADVSVPLTILAAWSLATTFAIIRFGRIDIAGRSFALGAATRGLITAAALVVVLVTTAVLVRPGREALGSASLNAGFSQILSTAQRVTERLQSTWPLGMETKGQMGLAKYLHTCLAPTDRVFIAPQWSPAIALAQRAFAGGQDNLRAGFFSTVGEQELAIERFERQSVPVVILPPADDLDHWAEAFPLIDEYFNREYENLGERDFDEGIVFSLLVHRNARVVGTYELLSLPCFYSGE
jgi:hypothetical protein